LKIIATADERNALIAGFAGWTLDAFDFFILTFTLGAVAKEFGRSIPAVALTLTATLAMRPVGAFIFGLMADRYGRRLPLMIDILFYSVLEVLSGLAPTYTIFFILRLLYGIGLGGEWGVGTSLVLESVPVKWRGLISGFLQQGYSFGFVLAAIAYYTVFPKWGWRPMFFMGGLPALLTLFIRAKVKESKAWEESRTSWKTYRRDIFSNWKIFLYLVLLMSMMNFAGHGTQDLYPIFLQKRHFSPQATAIISMIGAIGAVCGGVLFGAYSDRWGRRRSIITALLLAAALVPLWIIAPATSWLIVGAFLMQFMVQGAFGVIPSHITELSPNTLRGFFPGLAFQLGVLVASTITYVEAVLGERFGYEKSLGFLAAIVIIATVLVVWAGPEAKGVHFRKSESVAEPVASNSK
jgi:SHS family lactate transporter-like MFS transporter